MRLYDTVDVPEYLLERLDECIDTLGRKVMTLPRNASIRLLDKDIKAVVHANEDIYTYLDRE